MQAHTLTHAHTQTRTRTRTRTHIHTKTNTHIDAGRGRGAGGSFAGSGRGRGGDMCFKCGQTGVCLYLLKSVCMCVRVCVHARAIYVLLCLFELVEGGINIYSYELCTLFCGLNTSLMTLPVFLCQCFPSRFKINNTAFQSTCLCRCSISAFTPSLSKIFLYKGQTWRWGSIPLVNMAFVQTNK
jgi:hypothetical protein